MSLFLATSYDGLGEGLVVLGSWTLAALLLLAAVLLISFRKSRQKGRKLAVVAFVAGIVQFLLYLFLRDAAKLGAGVGTIIFFNLPLVASVFVLMLTPKLDSSPRDDIPKSA